MKQRGFRSAKGIKHYFPPRVVKHHQTYRVTIVCANIHAYYALPPKIRGLP